MTTVAELRAKTAEGYNLAVLVPLDQDIKDMTPLLAALPVLKEASGALGVLRALDLPGRMPGIQREMMLSGKQYRLWHLVFNPPTKGVAVLHDYTFILHAEGKCLTP